MDKRLTELTKSSGWAAKIQPDILAQVLSQLPKMHDERLIVGLETSDDAAVYKMDENRAIIQTLDFFTPVVDDPYTFGQIAAANSLSDIYAMGGEPTLAMNIVCFPDCLKPEVLAEILKGGQSKVAESGAILVGGHSISDDEPKYGLSVTGFVHPEKVWTNGGAKVGDLLILTKPLGLGIINTAIIGGLADKDSYDEAVFNMITLNKYAKESIDKEEGINSVTDVTGFGIIGHAQEMAESSNTSIRLYAESIPLIKNTINYAEMGLVPAGTYTNKNYFKPYVGLEGKMSVTMEDILYDPQTSGGLLISVSRGNAAKILDNLKKTPTKCAIIGEVVEREKHHIIIL